MMLHLDLDCFFVSAHRIRKPMYRNIPLAVGGRSNLSIFERKKQQRQLSKIGGAFTSSILSFNDDKSFKDYFVDPDGRVRGIVTTASYEARAFGVKTAMSVSEALARCPKLTVLPPNYPLYHELSNKLKELLQIEIPSIEQFSIDEFFGDVTGYIKDEDVYEFAVRLKDKIQRDLGLPISIGISRSKWIAKLATEKAKPHGIYIVRSEEVDSFVKDLSISEFPGIGKGYQTRLEQYGIKTLGDIKKRKELFYKWGKPGIQLYHRTTGTDTETIALAKSKKSIGLGRTFDPLEDREEAKRRVVILCRHLSFLALKGKHNPMTYSLRIKYQYGEKAKDFINANRLFNEKYFKEAMTDLFNQIDRFPRYRIVQLNVSLSSFEENKNITMDLLNYQEDTVQSKLTASQHLLRSKYGIDIIKSGGEF
ncbi:MAG: DNA polymerase IV [Campylobacterales bacterium]|nr:DNA polymerase IV [Campylobacterales bacterium]